MKTNQVSHVMNTNTNTLTKVVIGLIALTGLSYLGLSHKSADYMPMLGYTVGYLAALVILGLAALDNRGAKRLS